MLLFAHGIVGRADLPIPETLFGAAAAAVLVVSFVALALGWSRPRLKALPEQDAVRLPAALEVLLGALGVARLLRHRLRRASPAPSGAEREPRADVVYVAFWVGVPFASLLFGNVFAADQPVARARPRDRLGRAARFGDELPEPLAYPERARPLPAAAGLFGFAICELCWARGDRARPAGDPDARSTSSRCSSG